MSAHKRTMYDGPVGLFARELGWSDFARTSGGTPATHGRNISQVREAAGTLSRRVKVNPAAVAIEANREINPARGSGTEHALPMAPRSFAPLAAGTSGRAPPLVIQVAHGLMQDIVDGRYKAGTWIREQDVASRFDSSRGPVREALRLLEIDGLVEVVPWRGARVMNLTIDEIDDLFVLVEALMVVVARFAAHHATDKDINAFSRRVDAMEETITKGLPAREQLIRGFRAGAFLGQICGSPRAAWTYRRIGNLAYWHHQPMLSAGMSFRRSSFQKWRVLAQALEDRDAKKVESVTKRLVEQSRRFVISRLRAEQTATTERLSNARPESAAARRAQRAARSE